MFHLILIVILLVCCILLMIINTYMSDKLDEALELLRQLNDGLVIPFEENNDAED